MKSLTKFVLTAASLAIVPVSTSMADSHENQIRLHLQQLEMARQQESSPSVAIYSSRHEVHQSVRPREDRWMSHESRYDRYDYRDDRREHVYGTWLKK